MRNLAVLLALLSLFIGALFAQKPADPAAATKEDVQQLLEAMQSRKLLEGVRDQLQQQLPELTLELMKKQVTNPTDGQIAQMRTFANQQVAKSMATMPINQMLDATIPAYQRHFNHDEVQQIRQFYLSPVGQKLMTEMPALMAEGTQQITPLMQQWQESMMADLQKSAEDFAAQLKGKAPAAPEPKKP